MMNLSYFYDNLKFIQRVLESDNAPKADRDTALHMCKEIRNIVWVEQMSKLKENDET